MENKYVVREADMKKVFDERGFAMVELLPGSYQGGVRNYKCWLKAGCESRRNSMQMTRCC